MVHDLLRVIIKMSGPDGEIVKLHLYHTTQIIIKSVQTYEVLSRYLDTCSTTMLIS